MRILFENEILNATLSATNQNANYPIANVKHDFLTVPFKATDTSSVVTFTFSSVKTIDCCYIGFTNATSAVLKLYSIGSVLLSTVNLDIERGGQCFTSTPSVSYGTVTLTGSENIYLGAIAAGDSFTMPNPLATIIPDKVDNSKVYESDNGQISINKVEWLRKIEPSFFVEGIEDYNTVKAQFANVSHPVWVDTFENSTDTIKPIYGYVQFTPDSKDGRLYNFKVEVKECR